MTTGTLARVKAFTLVYDGDLAPVHGQRWLDPGELVNPGELVIILTTTTNHEAFYALSLVSSGEIGWILVARLATVM